MTDSASGSEARCVCGILHDNDGLNSADKDGCLLALGHDGPHEFVDLKGQSWRWDTDLECDCEHCQRCEGDYCTVYWPKPASLKRERRARS